MSYDGALFALTRTRDGATVPVDVASFTLNTGYTETDLGFLQLDADTAEVALSSWDAAAVDLQVGDAVTATYDQQVIFLGSVEAVTTTYVVDPAAARHGATTRVDVQASLAGYYSTALHSRVSGLAAPVQGAYARLVLVLDELGITIDNATLGEPPAQAANTPVPALTTGEEVNALDAIRAFSAATGLPARWVDATTVTVVVDPTGPLDAEDPATLYTSTTWQAGGAQAASGYVITNEQTDLPT